MSNQARMKQAMIGRILMMADRPLNSKEISDRLLGHHGIKISTATIGANIAYMRRAGEVKGVPCLMHMLKVGFNVYPHMLNHWFPGYLPDSYGRDFSRKMRRQHEARFEASKPLPERRKKKPRTDDMRQMIEDLGVSYENQSHKRRNSRNAMGGNRVDRLPRDIR